MDDVIGENHMTTNQKIDQILEKVNLLDTKVDSLDAKADSLDKRTATLESDMKEVKQQMKSANLIIENELRVNIKRVAHKQTGIFVLNTMPVNIAKAIWREESFVCNHAPLAR